MVLSEPTEFDKFHYRYQLAHNSDCVEEFRCQVYGFTWVKQFNGDSYKLPNYPAFPIEYGPRKQYGNLLPQD